MKVVTHDGGIIYYQDKHGNELRVWEEDGHLLGANFNGVTYGNVQQGMLPNSTYKWQRIGKGKIGKAFWEWLEHVEKEIKNSK
ncbi:hypothetical protein CN918_29180 [Priestia megaterium]|nr:hypothetical protein CN918_29180 [Priestia megaterium]